jgi:hypothetical protein
MDPAIQGVTLEGTDNARPKREPAPRAKALAMAISPSSSSASRRYRPGRVAVVRAVRRERP